MVFPAMACSGSPRSSAVSSSWLPEAESVLVRLAFSSSACLFGFSGRHPMFGRRSAISLWTRSSLLPQGLLSMVRHLSPPSNCATDKPPVFHPNRHANAWQAGHGEADVPARERVRCGMRVHHLEPEADPEGGVWDDQQGHPGFRCDLGFLDCYFRSSHDFDHKMTRRCLDFLRTAVSMCIIPVYQCRTRTMACILFNGM